MSRPSDRAIAEAIATIEALRRDMTIHPTTDAAYVVALEALRAAELDASGDAEPAGVVNWTGEGGTSVTAALYRPLPHGTRLYTHPPVESAPGFVLVPREPTREMMLAAARYQYGDDCVIDAALNADYVLDSLAATYRAMLAAAQENAP